LQVRKETRVKECEQSGWAMGKSQRSGDGGVQKGTVGFIGHLLLTRLGGDQGQVGAYIRGQKPVDKLWAGLEQSPRRGGVE